MDKIIDNLYLGDIRSAQDPEALQRNYITHIVTLDKSLAPMYPKKYQYRAVPVENVTTENIGKHFNPTIKFIKSAIRRDAANVLVHCMTGNEVGPCFIAAYMIKMHHYTV